MSTPMRELRLLPPPPGQTDLFGDPAFAGAGGPMVMVVDEVAQAEPENPRETGHQLDGMDCDAKAETGTPTEISKAPKKTKSRCRAAKPVTGKTHRKSFHKEPLSAGAKQARCRSSKKKRGLRLLEVWVPAAVKCRCRAAALRGKTSMGRVASGLLAAALGVAVAGAAKGSP